jgi:hypothetical protein
MSEFTSGFWDLYIAIIALVPVPPGERSSCPAENTWTFL